MLDIKWLRENPDVVAEAARKKRIEVDVGAILEADATYRSLLCDVEERRAEAKRRSQEMKDIAADERVALLEEGRRAKQELKGLEAEASKVQSALQVGLLTLPMPPDPEVPEGSDDSQNVELRTWGEVPDFSFDAKDHVSLGADLGILDIPRGVKLAGSRNYLLLGDGARLEQAVLRFAVAHMTAKGFDLASVPILVNHACMEGTGYFPGGEEQTYAVPKDDLFLSGTSEVPLTAIHSGETLEESDLPVRRIALSPCFRREAGTYGKEAHGLYRVHQFWKVEQMVIGPNDEDWSIEEQGKMLAHAEEFVQALEIPYRVVDVCTGDLGQGQVRKFDIEAWMPSRGSWGETHSASRFHDFQARRLNLRYKPSGGGKPRFCHTLNNTVAATPRLLIPLLELGQQSNGDVVLPEALESFMGKVLLENPAKG